MLVDRKDAIAKGLAMLRNGQGCEVLYRNALWSVHGNYIDERTTAGRELASIVASILVEDPKSRVEGIAYCKN